ncbi:MAG: dTDP-4-dehydrorhamnose 3,5-epimerase [Gemmatimonadota bacterium]
MIEPTRMEDERGWFARLRCEEEFARLGLEGHFVQSSLSVSRRRGVLRGLHFQVAPREEVKLVRCVRGSIHDVIVDLRSESSTLAHYFSALLSDENHKAVYVPRGFAHGFQALEDNTEVLYEISEFYSPEHARGFRWNDPAFGIVWPIGSPILHGRDREYADFSRSALT